MIIKNYHDDKRLRNRYKRSINYRKTCKSVSMGTPLNIMLYKFLDKIRLD